MEYPVFSLERPDFIFIVVGKNRALIVEAKGWRSISRLNDYLVMADGTVHVEPCYQLRSRVSKFKFFHSVSAIRREHVDGFDGKRYGTGSLLKGSSII